MKKTALFDMVNSKRGGRRIGQRLERHRVGGNALGPGRGRASACLLLAGLRWPRALLCPY